MSPSPNTRWEAATHAAQMHETVMRRWRPAPPRTSWTSCSERKAFGIAEDDGGANPLDTMSEHQLEAEIAKLEAARESGA